MKKMAIVVTLAVSALPWLTAAGRAAMADVMSTSLMAEAKKDISGAMKALKTMEASPKDEKETYIYNLRMGWLAYLGGMWNDSIAYYDKAADIEPDAVEPLTGMLLPLAAVNKPADIMRAHERILKVDPANYKSLSQVAWLNYSAKAYKKAAQYYFRILKFYPTDLEMLLGLGYSLKYDGDKAGAEKMFRQVLLLSPQNARALEGLKS